jgi:uncharacterized protein
MANYLILSCDGGGIRGYLSSLLLQRLNDDLGIFGSNNQNIDLYAGTSTGGLIALALAQGKSIDSIVDLYATAGKDIFYPASFQPGCLLGEAAGAAAGLADVKGLWQVLYDDIDDPSVQSVIESFIPGNPLLSSLASNVMVTTFQLSDSATPPSWNPLVIDNFAGSPGSSTYLWDAALSTSAAPVYFPPYNLRSSDGAATGDCLRIIPRLWRWAARFKRASSSRISCCFDRHRHHNRFHAGERRLSAVLRP